jgi:hypothetical protein
LNDLVAVLEMVPPEDFADGGFREVWIADETGIDAYGDVELYCLHPAGLRGYYPQNRERKPYG